MSATAGMIQLQEAFKTLRLHWEETKQYWADEAKRTFEETYWTPLEVQVRATQQAMEHLAQVLGAAKQDSSP